MTLEKVIKEINEIMGKDNIGSQLTIKFFTDDIITFGIYEQEIPIIVDKKAESTYLNCELCNSHLTYDMLNELTQITKVIQDNIKIIIACV